jgi:anti-sigma factor ChrR (cupin superfamily)
VAKGFEHLSSAQLEQYGAGSYTATSDDARAIEAHLEDCANCRSRLLEHHRAQFALLADSPRKAPSKEGSTDRDLANMPSGHCPSTGGPSEDDLRNLAAGLFAPDKAIAMTHHVANCSHCAPILSAFIEDFSDDLTDEETATLSVLESSSTDWPKKLVRKLFPPK